MKIGRKGWFGEVFGYKVSLKQEIKNVSLSEISSKIWPTIVYSKQHTKLMVLSSYRNTMEFYTIRSFASFYGFAGPLWSPSCSQERLSCYLLQFLIQSVWQERERRIRNAPVSPQVICKTKVRGVRQHPMSRYWWNDGIKLKVKVHLFTSKSVISRRGVCNLRGKFDDLCSRVFDNM